MGWQSSSGRQWTKQFSDFRLQTDGIHGLIGSSRVDPDLQIYGNSKPVSVESAELRTATGNLPAEIYDSSPIPPSKSGYHIPVKWKFDQQRSAVELLGAHCQILLKLKVGDESRQIEIDYEK